MITIPVWIVFLLILVAATGGGVGGFFLGDVFSTTVLYERVLNEAGAEATKRIFDEMEDGSDPR